MTSDFCKQSINVERLGVAEALLGLKMCEANPILTDDEKELPSICNRLAPSNDVRLVYMSMLNNVLNSYDFDMIHSFWVQFSLPKPFLKMSHRIIGDLTIPKSISFQGMDCMVAYWCSMLQLGPDTVSNFSNVKVHTRSDMKGESVVIARANAKCTLLYGVPVSAVVENYIRTRKIKKGNDDTNANSSKKYKKKARKQHDYVFPPTEPVKHYLSENGQLPLLPKPLCACIQGLVYVYLNAERQIKGFELQDVLLMSNLCDSENK